VQSRNGGGSSCGRSHRHYAVGLQLSVMRDANAESKRRDAMAVAAAPYLHPKLSSVEATKAERLSPAEKYMAYGSHLCARRRIMKMRTAATNAAEATDEADDANYFAVLDQAGNAAEAAAAEITGYNTFHKLY
jgi:hypothetical protein